MNIRGSIRSAARMAVAAAVLAAGTAAPGVAAPPLREYGAPARIAPMDGNLFLVSDFAEGAVHIVRARDLGIVRSVAIEGNPVGIAWSRGRIYVGNETKGQVEAYALDGKRVASYGLPGSIRLPNSVVVLEDSGRLLVLDAYDKSIKAFAIDGDYLGTLTPPGVLANPSAMGYDASRGYLLVSDFGAFSSSLFRKGQAYVRLFDLGGAEVARFSLAFSRPQGLAVDGKGRLFVVESFLGQVRVLDANTGTELGILGGQGMLDLPLDAVYCAGIDSLLVTDSRNGRIAVLAPGAMP